jgi:hypothetical protein
VVARHVREVGEELRELMPALDVVDERPHRHTRTRETGFAAKAGGARRDEGSWQCHRSVDNRSTPKVAGCGSCV